ncbi:F-type H+-transporting ATPase subunit b [Roseimicrobium gellanilyticum]|uniref:ATP synthase subunit b n=1 Tax=Roseimicrobium gellanilyticum TaxID=748857 RepID=A0A366H6N4_9BACT|nr:F0F1 ATP synthase subunit B [Roseimicrobium gellanilyticum]RBP37346.1 F-type H+-transporting ATPase subunit b [Roseimicrobium gellanilyticum]
MLEQFGIQWPKIIAQVFTFGIVYFVLNRYAFGPIVAMLEARRKRIADGEAKLEKIARDLAAAEENARAIIDKANTDGNRLIKEANDSAAAVKERKAQEAVAEANSILAKAREASKLEQEQLLTQLKREFGRMVVDATGRVTGKVLTNEDQDRINRETAAQVAL